MNKHAIAALLLLACCMVHGKDLELTPCGKIQELVTGADVKLKPGVLFTASTAGGGHLAIFGTIHIGKAAYYPLPSSLIQYLDASSLFVNESEDSESGTGSSRQVTFSPADLTKRANWPKTQLLISQSPLLPEQKQQVAVAFQHIVPLMAAMWVSDLLPMSSKEHEAPKIDDVLLEYAKSKGIHHVGLEAKGAYVEQLSALSLEEQLQLYDSQVEKALSGDLVRERSFTRRAWEHGDFEKLQCAQDNESNSPAENKVSDILGRDVNRQWIPRLLQLIKDRPGENIFVAIGVAHLIGKDGFVSQLKIRGIELKPDTLK